jgi:membrane carboxypeptidase/penicillin-binding protein PbpC
LVDGVILRNPSNRRGTIRARAQALGSDGQVRWLLNDRFLAYTQGDASVVLQFDRDGDQRLVAIDAAGRYDRVSVRVIGTGN